MLRDPDYPYTVIKVSTDGSQDRREARHGFSLEDVRDLDRFPAGIQKDEKGFFTWGYYATEFHR